MTIVVDIALAEVQAKPPVVVQGDSLIDTKYDEVLTLERSNQPDNAKSVQDDSRGCEDDCPRKLPLTQTGPRQVSYEFEKHGLVPDLLPVAPVRYVKVCASVRVCAVVQK